MPANVRQGSSSTNRDDFHGSSAQPHNADLQQNAPCDGAIPEYAHRAAPIAESGKGERLARAGIGRRDESRMVDPVTHAVDTLHDRFWLWLSEDGRLYIAIARAASDRLFAFHASISRVAVPKCASVARR